MNFPINENDPIIRHGVEMMRKNNVPGPYVINGESNEIAEGIIYGWKPGTGQTVSD